MQYVSRDRKNQGEMIEYTNSQIAGIIDEVIHSERDRAILKRRLIDGRTFEQLSEEFSISVRCVKNIVYKQQSKVFSNLPFNF